MLFRSASSILLAVVYVFFRKKSVTSQLKAISKQIDQLRPMALN